MICRKNKAIIIHFSVSLSFECVHSSAVAVNLLHFRRLFYNSKNKRNTVVVGHDVALIDFA